MPYIPKPRRDVIDLGGVVHTPGELNYAITHTLLEWLDGRTSYDTINEAIGVLECAKLELYRRVAAPYEDYKKGVNGEIYPTQA